MTKNYADDTVLTEAQLDAVKSSIETWANTTKLDSDNIQDGGLDADTLASNVVTTVKINDGAVTTAKIADDAITPAKLNSDLQLIPNLRQNLGIERATTTNSGDSIKITSQNGSALSSSNPGFLAIADGNEGRLVVVEVTSDVTIDLTGAHWGLGTDGDQTDYPLSVYALHDGTSLKWGVTPVNGLYVVDTDDDVTSQSSATDLSKVLVNSALSADAWAVEVGWFRADFDDTGGAAEDLWNVGSGRGKVNQFPMPDGFKRPYTPTTSGLGTVTVHQAFWTKIGQKLQIYQDITIGTPTASEAQFGLPPGLTIATGSFLYAGVGRRGGENDVKMLLATAGDSFLNVTGGGTYPTHKDGNTEYLTGQRAVNRSDLLDITGWI